MFLNMTRVQHIRTRPQNHVRITQADTLKISLEGGV